jgi:hypothetical protein
MSRRIVMKSPAELRPHPLSKELYGAPTENDQYANIRFSMLHGGFIERHALLITEDGRIISGTTRWAAARSVKLDAVPCELFVPQNPATAELEIEAQLIIENGYRTKTRLMVARAQRKLLELQKALARARMAHGRDADDDEPSKSVDRVGAAFKVSGKTVTTNLKVLAAIDRAAAEGDARKAARLTELLEHGKTGKALDLIDGKAAGRPKKPVKVEVPRTLNDHNSRAYGENFEAVAKIKMPAETELVGANVARMFKDVCAKAQVAAELDSLEANLERMRQDLDAARARLAQLAE